MGYPHAAGAAALCNSIDSTLSVATIRERLRATAQDRGPAGLDEKYGFGIRDCVAAVIQT
ncbi:S8 family serine peptidase [Ralstonia solanacearum]|uniref:S8 family serine peptidase n=1 Tax=Ralstonia solanacearum TaxID=305 RepID=UPI000B0F6990